MSVNQILSALADDTRRAILLKLRQGRMNSGELAEYLNITPQALSYHLNKLKKADLIVEEKVKNYIYFELNLSVLGELMVWLDSLKDGKEPEGGKDREN